MGINGGVELTKWFLEVQQNGGEYYGNVHITCEELVRVGDCVIIADGVRIEFDEYISEIKRTVEVDRLD